MLNYQLLEALSAVAKGGGFQKGARLLHLTQSAISQRIRALEEELGSPVLIRSTPPKVTHLGQKLLAHLDEVRILESSILGAAAPSATLTIGVNADSLATWLFAALRDIIQSRGLLLTLRVDNENRTQELLRSGGVFGCVTSRERNLPGCESEFLGVMQYRALCTKQFKKKYFKDGITKESIGRAPSVAFDEHDDVNLRFVYKLLSTKKVSLPLHYIPSPQGYLESILQGISYGLVPDLQVKSTPSARKLINLAQDISVDVRLYFHYLRRNSTALREIADSFVDHSRELLNQK